MQKWVIASGNQGKLAEFKQLLAPLSIDLVSQASLDVPEAEETGLTFIENALIKARNACEHTGLPALADDSGLAVEGLGGAPGIYSARFAGPQASDSENIQKLLTNLDGETNRRASFHCVLVWMRHKQDPTPLVCHGQWLGEILSEPRGEHGFGYDPIFWVPDAQKSAAELSKSEKNQRSHRGQALRQLLQMLQ